MKNPFQLFAIVVFGCVGTIAIVMRQLRSATVHEMAVSGLAAQVVGVLYIVIAVMLLVDWVRKFRKNDH